MHRSTRAATATALLVLGTAAPAHADSATYSDPAGDLWSIDGGTPARTDVALAQGDVVGARLSHTRKRVTVRLAFEQLARIGTYSSYTVVLQGRGRTKRVVVVEASPRRWSGKVTVFTPGGARVTDCRERRAIDYTRATVSVSVSGACLRNARMARFSANTFWVEGDSFFLDNPFDTRASTGAWSRWVKRPSHRGSQGCGRCGVLLPFSW